MTSKLKQTKAIAILDMCLKDIETLEGKGAVLADFNASDIRMVMQAIEQEPELTVKLQDHILASYASMEKAMAKMLNNSGASEVITSETLSAQVGSIIREESIKNMIGSILVESSKKIAIYPASGSGVTVRTIRPNPRPVKPFRL